MPAVCTLSFRVRRAHHHHHHHQQQHFAISRQPNMLFSLCMRTKACAYGLYDVPSLGPANRGGVGVTVAVGVHHAGRPQPPAPAAKHPSIHPSIHPSKVFNLLCLLISALTSKKNVRTIRYTSPIPDRLPPPPPIHTPPSPRPGHTYIHTLAAIVRTLVL